MILKARAEKGALSSAAPLELALALQVLARGGRDVEGARQVGDDAIKHGLDALVLEGGAAKHRDGLVGDGRPAQGGPQVSGGDLLVVQELLGDRGRRKWKRCRPGWRASTAASASRAAGISTTLNDSPRGELSSQTSAFISNRSTTPAKLLSTPIGSCTTATVAPSRSWIMSTQRAKLAPMRSILLTKQMRGTWYLSACRHTVSVWGSTPATASKTAMAPSRTRSDRSTSTVKSTWPGVSMMLMRWSSH